MPLHHVEPADALGLRRQDVVLPHHVQHVRLHITGIGGDGAKTQYDNRKDNVLPAPPSGGGQYHQLDAENVLEHRRQDEDGHRDTQNRDEHHDIVRPFVLIEGGDNPKEDTDDKPCKEGQPAWLRRHGGIGHQGIRDLTPGIPEGFPHLPLGKQVLHEDHILFRCGLVQPIFLIIVRPGLLRKVPCHVRKGVSGDAVHQKEGCRDNDEQRKQHISDTFCDKFCHLFSSFLSGDRGFSIRNRGFFPPVPDGKYPVPVLIE